ncbi:MAG: serine protease [Deltaproteobacteria bacterium]|nr:serine protease [Deltaproteobacteria bacterium]
MRVSLLSLYCTTLLILCSFPLLASDAGTISKMDDVKTDDVKADERVEDRKDIDTGALPPAGTAVSKRKPEATDDVVIAPKTIAVDYSAFVKAVEPMVVKIEVTLSDGSKATGSGFFVNAAGVLATNAHVVKGAATGSVLFSDGRRQSLVGTYVLDEDHDIAIVKVAGYDKDASPFLLLGSTKTLSAGAPVVAFGSPKGLTNSISTGIVSAIRVNGLRGTVHDDKSLDAPVKQRVIQHSASISPGSSGSPLMNLEGIVLGINTFHRTGGQNLNFAVPVERIQEHLDKLDFSPTATSEKRAKLHPLGQGAKGKPVLNLLISLGIFLAVALGVWRLGRNSEA